jgi:intracellular sulfur oxidation DsrE/DsrF family protein
LLYSKLYLYLVLIFFVLQHINPFYSLTKNKTVMKQEDLNQTTPRRGFLGILASGAAALGLATLASPLNLNAQTAPQKNAPKAAAAETNEADLWFNKLKGKHRIVFDATRPHEVMPFAWPAVFLMTNNATGSPASDCGVVVVLRHDAIPYAFEDRLWEKYKFSEVFKGAGELGPGFQAADAATAAKVRNPFWKPKLGDFKVPGIGAVAIGINDLQASGVMFCVCNAAMTVYSAIVADTMKMTPEDVMKDWKAGLLSGVQVVPSGVWAVGRAQEHGCKYCFAG